MFEDDPSTHSARKHPTGSCGGTARTTAANGPQGDSLRADGGRETRQADRLATLALLVGFAALSGAVAVAHASPTTGYELSIYRATPVLFWVGVGIGFAAALATAGLIRPRYRLRVTALALAVAASVTVASLPVLRGYYFYGAGDALTHYGWAKDIASGAMNPFDLLYPGVHTSGLLLSSALGVPLRLGLILVVTIFVALFVTFVALCVRAVAGDPGADALVVGTFTGVLLLPINDVSVFVMVHPSSDAILFAPFVLYAAFRYLTTPVEGPWFRVTPTGGLLALASASVVLVHPQQALNVALVFGSIVAVQQLARVWNRLDAVTYHRSFLPQAAFLAVAFLAWVPQHHRTQSVSTVVLQNLLVRGPSQPGTISTHSTSLAALGGGIVELFVKLFLPSLLFCGLASLVMLAALRRTPDASPRRGLATYLTAAMGPLAVAFAVFSVALSGEQRFRYVGFVMVPVLILGAVALTRGVRLARSGRLRRTAWPALSLFFAVLLPLCLATYFLAPFIYQPNSQVTESQITGYTWAFEHADTNTPFLGVHSGSGRYADVIYGTTRVDTAVPVGGLRSVVPPPVLTTNLTTHYPTARYLAVSDADQAIEERLYAGLRYPQGSLSSPDRTVGVDRVASNGGVRLYYVQNRGGDGDAQAPANNTTAAARNEYMSKSVNSPSALPRPARPLRGASR